MTLMRKRDRSLLANGTSLLVCGLLAGLVVAAAAFPAVAMGGLAAKAGADTFDSLPTDVEVLPAPQISEVYANDGKTLLALLYDENRRDVPIAEVAEIMQKAMVASEDSRFYEHNGVDMKGVARAFVNNQQGGDQQGASTLTMQYVRQIISYSAKTPQEVVAATEDTAPRKLAEIKRALAIEKKLSKQDILERYLNIASFGNGAYGIYAASQVYFGKLPADLTLGEAALVAGTVKAPSSFDLADPKKLPLAMERRDNYVLPQMLKMGYITQQQLDETKAAGAPKIVGKRTPEGCAQVQRPELNAGFFCDYLVRWWANQEKFGADSYERLNKLRSAGYKIVSSLDLQAQAGAMRSINEVMAKKPQHEAMLLAGVQPGSGQVQALAVNRIYSNDQSGNGVNTNPAKKAAGIKGNYPRTTVPMLTGGGDVQGYQAGSVFKLVTIAAALEKGYPLSYPINTVSPYHSKYPLTSGPAKCPEGPYYCPENSGKKPMGVRNMWTGLASSVNTYFVPLQERIGTENVVAMAHKLGIEFHNDTDREQETRAPTWGAFTLGVTTQTPLEMANAYATLAADGIYCKPTPVAEILDKEGKKISGAEPDCKQVVDPDVARGAVDAARCPVGDQSTHNGCTVSGTAPDTRRIVAHPVFGKTGTTDDEKSATLIISTKQLTMAGFYTDPDWPQTNQRFSHNGGVNPAVQNAMKYAMSGKPSVNFEKPSQKIALGIQVNIPNVKCNTVQQATTKIRNAGFEVDTATQKVPSDCAPGTVAGTDPSGRAAKGSVVVLQISGGPAASAPPSGGTGGGGPAGGGQSERCKRLPFLCPTPPPRR